MKLNLSKRTLINLSAIVLALSIFYWIFFHLIVINNIRDLEDSQVERNIIRVESIISSNLSALGRKSLDWSSWDDTYDFVQSFDQDYIDSNLQDNTFSDIGIDLFMIADNSNEIKVIKQYNIAESQSIIPTETDKMVLTDSISLYTEKGGTTGIIEYQGSPLTVSMQPILKTDSTGPRMGTLIMGRFVDKEYQNNISSIVLFESTVELLNNIKDNDSYSVILEELENGEDIAVTERDQNDDYITGYSFFRGLNQEDLLLTEVKIKRDDYKKAELSSVYFNISALVAMAICGLFMYLFISKNIISRIKELSDFLAVSEQDGNVVTRVKVEKNDEISMLEESINKLIDQASKKSK